MRRLLQLGSHKALTRVEHILYGVESAEFARSLNKRSHRKKERGGAASLDEQTILVYKQAALAQHVRVQIFGAREAEHFTVDQVEYVVDTVARYVAQIVFERAFLARLGEPDLQELFCAFKKFHASNSSVCLCLCVLFFE